MSAMYALPHNPPPRTKDILRLCAKHFSGDTLDYGAGTAKYRDIIKPHVSTYTTFDMIEGPTIDVVGDVLDPPFEDAKFDTVICTQVMEHVKEPWQMVEQIARLLKPGGKCVLTVPFLMPYHADPYDYYRYTLEGGRHLFTRAGMHIVESGKYGGILMVLAEMWKFWFCSPYKYKRPGFVRRNILRVVYNTLCFLGRKTDQTAHVYADIYIVAQKPE